MHTRQILAGASLGGSILGGSLRGGGASILGGRAVAPQQRALPRKPQPGEQSVAVDDQRRPRDEDKIGTPHVCGPLARAQEALVEARLEGGGEVDAEPQVGRQVQHVDARGGSDSRVPGTTGQSGGGLLAACHFRPAARPQPQRAVEPPEALLAPAEALPVALAVERTPIRARRAPVGTLTHSRRVGQPARAETGRSRHCALRAAEAAGEQPVGHEAAAAGRAGHGGSTAHLPCEHAMSCARGLAPAAAAAPPWAVGKGKERQRLRRVREEQPRRLAPEHRGIQHRPSLQRSRDALGARAQRRQAGGDIRSILVHCSPVEARGLTEDERLVRSAEVEGAPDRPVGRLERVHQRAAPRARRTQIAGRRRHLAQRDAADRPAAHALQARPLEEPRRDDPLLQALARHGPNGIIPAGWTPPTARRAVVECVQRPRPYRDMFAAWQHTGRQQAPFAPRALPTHWAVANAAPHVAHARSPASTLAPGHGGALLAGRCVRREARQAAHSPRGVLASSPPPPYFYA
eukprot:scaffold19380_cov107-Isochrysis_galbana.AAC.11